MTIFRHEMVLSFLFFSHIVGCILPPGYQLSTKGLVQVMGRFSSQVSMSILTFTRKNLNDMKWSTLEPFNETFYEIFNLIYLVFYLRERESLSGILSSFLQVKRRKMRTTLSCTTRTTSGWPSTWSSWPSCSTSPACGGSAWRAASWSSSARGRQQGAEDHF